jgi:hypothetical protein
VCVNRFYFYFDKEHAHACVPGSAIPTLLLDPHASLIRYVLCSLCACSYADMYSPVFIPVRIYAQPNLSS